MDVSFGLGLLGCVGEMGVAIGVVCGGGSGLLVWEFESAVRAYVLGGDCSAGG